MRGRKPLPTELKVISGAYTINPQRRNHNEPDAPNDEPECPDHLDAMARNKWNEITGYLREMNILSAAYSDLIELYAETYSMYRQAMEKVVRVGIATVSKDKNGNATIHRNPFETAAQKYRDALLKMESELGLTPSAKSRLHVDKKKAEISTRKRTG